MFRISRGVTLLQHRPRLALRNYGQIIDREQRMSELLKTSLNTEKVIVQDVSEVESPLFAGKRLVEQHRMVNELLSEELKNMHALTLTTKAPK
ncbi:hypothetical protein PROFUN_03231 [Planoprotostelium fungivorum]|uniref:Uncharacterized protein n=1 Tax=Planoprotostelium fungivorum TaxID=1890364 RepID=A0A2P6NX19_9EUKA|nr:hypothetical protein PROFUN_03231 [Planoprotostelium fungivorum]